MIDGMREGEESGHVIDSADAQKAIEQIAAAKLFDGILPGNANETADEWNKVVDLMNRLQDAAAGWFVANGLANVTAGFVDHGSTEFHIKGTPLNVPLL
ncbi:hypothetical protein [Paraburkholderia sp. SIMBA_054]|uniref:hypothetical protein n=1 Tax=Paraburkholderia sp. SIMBA_054 TaxID=3085795 RepID=UPI00397E89E0